MAIGMPQNMLSFSGSIKEAAISSASFSIKYSIALLLSFFASSRANLVNSKEVISLLTNALWSSLIDNSL